jgi:hypothetical protein
MRHNTTTATAVASKIKTSESELSIVSLTLFFNRSDDAALIKDLQRVRLKILFYGTKRKKPRSERQDISAR